MFSPKIFFKNKNEIINKNKIESRNSNYNSVNLISKYVITFNNNFNNFEINENINNISNSNLITENILLNIFINFADFSELDYEFYLSFSNLNKILKSTKIIEEEKISISNINIIFKKVKGNLLLNKLNFREFERFIFEIIMLINENEFKKRPKDYINHITLKYFKNFSNECNYIKIFNIIQNINSISFNSNIIKILSKIIFKLKEIYYHFFNYDIEHKIKNEILIKESLKSCINFFREYEILPNYFSIEEIVLYYYVILNYPEEEIVLFSKNKLGNNFNFQKFCHLFIVIGITIIDKKIYQFNEVENLINKGEDKINITHFINLNNEEKLLQFLNLINNSDGLEKTHRNYSCNTMNLNNSDIIPDKKYIDDYFPNAFKYKEKTKGKNFHLLKTFNEDFLINELNRKNELNISLYAKNQNIINKKILKGIFEYYSYYYEKYQMNKISYSDFIRFLKDFNLLQNQKIQKQNQNSNFLTINNNNYTKLSSSLRYSKLQTNTTIKVNQNNKSNKTNIELSNNLNKLTEINVNILWSNISGRKNKNKISLNTYSIKEKINLNRNSSLRSYKPNTITDNKLNYYQFIQILSSISQILSFDSFDIFIRYLEEQNECYNKINEKKNEIMNKYSIIEDKKSIKLLNFIKKIFKKYYDFYIYKFGNNKEEITFDVFIIIYKKLNILPYFVSFIELKNIFYVLSNNLIKNENLEKEKKIDFELFIISLGIISLNIKSTINISYVERLILILIKIAMSDYNNKILSNEPFSVKKDLFKIIIEIENKYPSIFEQEIPFYKQLLKNPEKLCNL
jgi:hypothetical protein